MRSSATCDTARHGSVTPTSVPRARPSRASSTCSHCSTRTRVWIGDQLSTPSTSHLSPIPPSPFPWPTGAQIPGLVRASPHASLAPLTMTNSAHSSSEPVAGAPAPAAPDRGAATPSAAYALYHPSVQRWIYDSGWERLRDAQERAAAPILAGDHDMIIVAATASGKTEAAWLPICSALVRRRATGEAGPGVQALFLSPLKALINDQYDRMTRLCERLDIPVHRWHGDVAVSRKSLVMRAPDGVLLITPESMEAMFVNHGDRVGRVLGDLRYVVIDELHSFIGTERGAQLQSLLHRVELCVRRGVPRIALSATLGDFTAAAEFLRPGKGSSVQVVSSDDDAGEIRLQLRGYRIGAPSRTAASRTGSPRTGRPADSPTERSGTDRGDNVETHDIAPIADHLFRTLAEHDNLIFANSRAAVETYADMLNRRSRATKIRTEFLAHHGSLAKEIREYVEERLKDRSTPVTAICTSTLEMGIDVGSVDSIAQIGAPPTVSSLRQRLGRSGRREDQPAVIRIYVSECELSDRTPPPTPGSGTGTSPPAAAPPASDPAGAASYSATTRARYSAVNDRRTGRAAGSITPSATRSAAVTPAPSTAGTLILTGYLLSRPTRWPRDSRVSVQPDR